jgi:2-oxoacid:acceptor oxidoreductase gamma subunit (pyruvate/2-ketoisovalerate family)
LEITLFEIRWHGRGGQGVVTAATLLAKAAYLYEGYAGVSAAPTFGAERRGAPISASTRIDAAPILLRSQVTHPDIVVVLDETLLDIINVVEGIKSNGTVIINTSNDRKANGFDKTLRLGLADASSAARKLQLVAAGSVVVNTAILGALCRTTEMVTIENMTKAIEEHFGGVMGQRNAQAARIAYDRTVVREREGANG